jgi:hypothetical protein
MRSRGGNGDGLTMDSTVVSGRLLGGKAVGGSAAVSEDDGEGLVVILEAESEGGAVERDERNDEGISARWESWSWWRQQSDEGQRGGRRAVDEECSLWKCGQRSEEKEEAPPVSPVRLPRSIQLEPTDLLFFPFSDDRAREKIWLVSRGIENEEGNTTIEHSRVRRKEKADEKKMAREAVSSKGVRCEWRQRSASSRRRRRGSVDVRECQETIIRSWTARRKGREKRSTVSSIPAEEKQ